MEVGAISLTSLTGGSTVVARRRCFIGAAVIASAALLLLALPARAALSDSPGGSPLDLQPLLPAFPDTPRGPILAPPATPKTFEGDLRDLPPAPRYRPGDPITFGYDGGIGAARRPTGGAPGSAVPQVGAPGAGGPNVPTGFSEPSESFEGISFTGFTPPDTNGDVGPNQYIQMVNAQFAIWDKDDLDDPVVEPTNFNELFEDFGGLCETTNRGDPIVVYDDLADRWLLSQFAFNVNSENKPIAPFFQCVAVSKTADPVTGGYNLYAFQQPTTNGVQKFPDYPHYGVWPDGYYFSTNQFGGTGGGGAFALERTAMLAGASADQIYFDTTERNMLPSDADGTTPPPAGSPNYFTKVVDGTPDRLEIREFHADFANPAQSTFGPATQIPVAAFDSNLCFGPANDEGGQCIQQPDGARDLEVLSDRLMWRLQYRNFGTHEVLVANHTIDVDGADRAGIRWYELRRIGAAWTLFQQGTHSPDTTARWMGSIAMDESGNIALGYSVSSTGVHPGIRYAPRLPLDPSGTLQTEVEIIDGDASQNKCQAADFDGDEVLDDCRNRWGDYSAMTVDPDDECTFWYTQEYIPAGGDWNTRIASFDLCNEAPTADANGPYTTDEGTDVVLDGSGSSDPDGDSLTYEWDFDEDDQFDDGTGQNPTFDLVGQDGSFPVALRVTDPDGESDTDEITVTVENVAPTISGLSADAPVDENSPLTLNATVTDPGWLDDLSATVDWDDGGGPQAVSGTEENVRPDATLTLDVTFTYGDNGVFTAEVCASDDDATTCETIDLAIDNVDPTAAIDLAGAVNVGGTDTFLAHAGEPIDFAGGSTDPGSDDLDLSWDWGDGPPSPDVLTSDLVNPPDPDPFPSPSIQPRDVTDEQSHAFGDACAYEITFASLDDDGGNGEDSADVIITGNAEETEGSGYWHRQYKEQGSKVFSEEALDCYLAIVRFVSGVFDEERPLSTKAEARDALKSVDTSGSRQILDQQLVAVWLNFANGALDLDELVDTDGDGTADTAFGDAVATAEAVRLDPNATTAEFNEQKDILEQINTEHQ